MRVIKVHSATDSESKYNANFMQPCHEGWSRKKYYEGGYNSLSKLLKIFRQENEISETTINKAQRHINYSKDYFVLKKTSTHRKIFYNNKAHKKIFSPEWPIWV